ncbi:unnamed protein product [Blepharisma stoltei]|uniref:RING-type domain-containing protein n=1 Tax=Blepharisma stoltei TaxID=1481888 RepID=A0AAU9JIN0_9CILI|nr:unnamed protein product [Blepharisma stoltei]
MSCSICISSFSPPICTLFCSHAYCFSCIQEWCKGHDFCPLCSQPISTATLSEADGSTQEIHLECKKAEAERSLMCLDHDYFKKEIAKLVRLAYNVEVERFKQRNSQGTPGEWKLLQNIKNRLEVLDYENKELIQFDPETLLDEVYTLDSQLKMVKRGDVPEDLIPREKSISSDEEDYYDD